MTELSKPTMTPHVGGLRFDWADLGITINIERLTPDGEGEIWVYRSVNGEPLILDVGQINLRSFGTRTQLAKRLNAHHPLDWDLLLNYVAPMTLQHIRQGEPVMELGGMPQSMKLDYLVNPILETGQPTTLYAPGGTVKSYLAGYIACAVQYNVPVLGGEWQPSQQGNALYLDWESTYHSHNRRIWLLKKGLGIQNAPERIAYRHCDNPLFDDLPSIQKIVSDRDIALVLVDSQTPASGYGQDAGLVASQFFNALRTLGCTTLVVDHKSKTDIRNDDDDSGPINSVVKFNRSRSLFTLKKEQSPGSDVVYLRLRHTKHNEGKLLEDKGIKAHFIENTDGYLDRVEFSLCDLAEVESLAPKGANNREKIINYMSDRENHEPKAIASAIATTTNAVSKELTKMKEDGLVDNPKRGEWRLL